jgi:DNA-binding IclR family transcriptional regulator
MPAPTSDGPTTAILRALAEQPGAPLAKLAEAAYGSSELRDRLRTGSLLQSLLKRGDVRRLKGRGRYAIKAIAKRRRAEVM